MKVTATQRGYYGSKVREPGDTFDLADKKLFSKAWMVKDKGGRSEPDLDRPEPVKEPASDRTKPVKEVSEVVLPEDEGAQPDYVQTNK